MAGTLLFVIGIGVSGVFAARFVQPDVPEGQQPTAGERIGAWWDAAGIGFVVGAAMMIGGGLAARRVRGVSEGPGGGGTSETALELMRQIRDRLAALPEDPGADPEGTKEKLDEVIEELIPKVLDRREAMIAKMGLGPFAEMIGQFAAMERNTARAWSALIDGVPEEIPPCLERARDGIDRALEAMEAKA